MCLNWTARKGLASALEQARQFPLMTGRRSSLLLPKADAGNATVRRRLIEAKDRYGICYVGT